MKREGQWFGAKYIVCGEPAFVYFIVQKVACSSIKTALLPLFPAIESEGKASLRDESFAYGVHDLYNRSGHQINQASLLADSYDRHFKFAFVRDPWDRLVSCYKQKIAPGGQGLFCYDYKEVPLHVGMSFAQFVEAVHAIPDEEADPHFRSQYLTVCGEDPNAPIRTDFVGHFEDLDTDFARVSEVIGARELRLPHLLSSGSGQNRSFDGFYNSRLTKLVCERYREDAEIFGYSRPNSKGRLSGIRRFLPRQLS